MSPAKCSPLRAVAIRLAFFLLLAAFRIDPAFSAPAYPDTIVLRQPDGSQFEARVRGDEFFGWYETVDGYPIEQDPKSKQWIYATDPSGRQTRSLQTARVVGQAAPSGTPWTPQESEESAQLRQAADQQRAETLADTQTRLRRGKRTASTTSAEKKLLTICVRFSDSPPASDLTPVSYFQNTIYGVTADPALPKQTVADYYLDVSGNKMLIRGEAVGWIDLPYTKAQYGGPSATGEIFDGAKLRMLIQNSATLLAESGFDFGPYDADSDGFVDMLAIVFEGQGEADGGGPDTIWPHQYSYEELWPQFTDGVPLNTGSKNAEGEDVFVGLYFTNPELNKSSADAAKLVRAPIGTFCHEFAHALGLPDLYDRTVPKSSGLGRWSLMASGSYNQANGQAGDCPAWPDPYCRLVMGWDREINVTSNTLRARIPEAKSPDRAIYRLWSEGQSTPQEFLVETRKRTGFDRGLPGEGLLVYHVSINDNTASSQNDVQWYLQPRAYTGEGHYLVALEQADGQFHLEQTQRSVVNLGDATDPYTTGGEFSDSTMPSSKAYPLWGELGEGPSTYVALRNIDTSQPDASYADIYVYQDQDQPQVSITSPSNMGPAVAELSEATGTAFDNSAVTAIRLWLQEARPGGRYYDWTSGSWRSDFAAETRKQIEPAAAWTSALPALPDGTYLLSVAAQDASGLESPVAVSQFTIDGDLLNPSMVINSPSGETYAEPPLVQGMSGTPASTTLTERRFALYSEKEARWYNWTASSFDDAAFDFASHVLPVFNADTSWNFSLPATISNGRYQIHAQSVNDRDRGAPWVSKSFVVTRTPTASLNSISHQALLQNMGFLSGMAQPQGSYLLTEIRITIYRNGKYWNGVGWVDESAYVTASVPPTGGAWAYAAALPADDGLYAVSVAAFDDQGSASAPVAGGNSGQNNILFQVDTKPPSVEIQWPPAAYVSTERTFDAAGITGTAVDGSGRAVVRVRLKRLSDGLSWSRYGWTSAENVSWHQGAFPGGDGDSQVKWVMEAALPHAGLDSNWCMPNGDYELTVEARDIVGNMASATRVFGVDYDDPLLAGVVETHRLPNQAAVGPAASAIGSSTFAVMSFSSSSGPQEAHAVLASAGGRYGVVASRINNSLFYGYSAREPNLLSVTSGGAEWSSNLSGPVQGEGGIAYQRTSSPPVVSFAADNSAVCASGLMQFNYGAARYDAIPQCEVVRFAADGSEQWRRLVPAPSATAWRGSTSASSLEVKKVSLLPDGATLMVGELSAHAVRPFYGQSNFRNHTLVMLVGSDGAVRWISRYGEESEDELLHENESFLFAEADGYGNVFVATRRGTATGPEQMLRKIRLSDGFTLSSFMSDACLAPETWGALAVDSTGRPLIAGAYNFGEGDARLSVKRLSANDLLTEWQAFGPSRSAYYNASWASSADVPLLRVDAHGVTAVHNSPGPNNVFGDNSDRILVSRFGSEGSFLWSQEINTPTMTGGGGCRADFAALTASGDVLLTGYFGTGSYNVLRGYAKVSGNGDLQFVKNLADQFDLSFGSFLASCLSGNGTQLATVYLNSDRTQMQVRLLDNPANVLIAPDLGDSLPYDTAVAVGGSFALESVNLGSSAVYQWYRRAPGADDFAALPGANSFRFTIPGATSSDAGEYRLVATNAAGQSTSRTATVTVVTVPPVVTSPLQETAYTGEYFSYQITADNAPSSFGIVWDPVNYPSGLSIDPNGTMSGFPSAAGTYNIEITATNPLGSDTQTLVLMVVDRPVVTLGDALDAPGLAWTTASVPNDWMVQDYYVTQGSHAAYSYAAPGSVNWIEAVVSGPGVLRFSWGAYFTFGMADRLALYMDGALRDWLGSSSYVAGSLPIPSGLHTIRWSLEAAPDSDYSTRGFLDAVSFSPSQNIRSWAAENGLSGGDASPDAAPRSDGIPNVLKYAFNMDPTVAQSGPDRHVAPGTGLSGLPDVRLVGSGAFAKLRVEFLRRTGEHDLAYTVQFSGDLGPLGVWESASVLPIVTPVNDKWERVVVEDSLPKGQAPRRFGRVVVTLQP